MTSLSIAIASLSSGLAKPRRVPLTIWRLFVIVDVAQTNRAVGDSLVMV